MTTTHERADLTAEVNRLAAELEEAQADAALLRRLNEAEAKAKRLATELRQAQAKLAEANAVEVQARRDAAFAGFEDVTVAERASVQSDSLLHCTYTISITRKVWDGSENVSKTTDYAGFDAVPSDVLAYLVERHPGRVPTRIMALCPEDPWEALAAYTVAKRRGYLVLPSAA